VLTTVPATVSVVATGNDTETSPTAHPTTPPATHSIGVHLINLALARRFGGKSSIDPNIVCLNPGLKRKICLI